MICFWEETCDPLVCRGGVFQRPRCTKAPTIESLEEASRRNLQTGDSTGSNSDRAIGSYLGVSAKISETWGAANTHLEKFDVDLNCILTLFEAVIDIFPFVRCVSKWFKAERLKDMVDTIFELLSDAHTIMLIAKAVTSHYSLSQAGDTYFCP